MKEGAKEVKSVGEFVKETVSSSAGNVSLFSKIYIFLTVGLLILHLILFLLIVKKGKRIELFQFPFLFLYM